MIIDCHGHYTTAPGTHTDWRASQLAAFREGRPAPDYPAHLRRRDPRVDRGRTSSRLLRERGADMTIFSPRASAMAHHEGDEAGQHGVGAGAATTCIARVAGLFPETFIGVCQLPQSPGVPLGALASPSSSAASPSSGSSAATSTRTRAAARGPPRRSPTAYWYPLYEKMAELDVPAMVHVSASCNPNFHATGAHYINADTTAFMQLHPGRPVRRLPDLRLVIPHGGGAVPYHWGRYRGLADMLGKPPLSEHVMSNVFFDTCVYHQPGIDLLFRVIDADNILFGSEMVGAVRGIDPETGHYFDDTKRYIDAPPCPRPTARRSTRATPGGSTRASTRPCANEDSNWLATFTPDADWLARSTRTPASRATSRRPARWTPLPRVRPRRRVPLRARSGSTRRSTAGEEQLFALRDFTRLLIATSSSRRPATAPTTAPWWTRCAAGKDRARGVATIRPGVVPRRSSRTCTRPGSRGIRFNFVKRLWPTPSRMTTTWRLAEAVAGFGWHIVVYFEAPDLAERWQLFTSLPTIVVVDHMGRPDVSQPVDGPGFAQFTRFMREHENVWSKVSGAERLSVSARRATPTSSRSHATSWRRSPTGSSGEPTGRTRT